MHRPRLVLWQGLDGRWHVGRYICPLDPNEARLLFHAKARVLPWAWVESASGLGWHRADRLVPLPETVRAAIREGS